MHFICKIKCMSSMDACHFKKKKNCSLHNSILQAMWCIEEHLLTNKISFSADQDSIQIQIRIIVWNFVTHNIRGPPVLLKCQSAYLSTSWTISVYSSWTIPQRLFLFEPFTHSYLCLRLCLQHCYTYKE